MTRLRPLPATLMTLLFIIPVPVSAGAVINLLPAGGGVDETRPTDPGIVGPLSGGSRDSSTYEPAEFDAPPSLQTRHFGGRADLSCRVAGTPGALVLTNGGSDPLPSGTRIKWQLKGVGLFGFFALVNDLDGGESLLADNVVNGTPDRSAACLARVI